MDDEKYTQLDAILRTAIALLIIDPKNIYS